MSILSAIALSRAPASAFVAIGLNWGCIAAMAPVLKARVGVDDATFGLLLLGTAVGLSVTVWLAPRWDRGLGQWALIAGTVALAAASLGPALAMVPLGLFLALTLLGVTSGVTDVVMNARVSTLEAASGGL